MSSVANQKTALAIFVLKLDRNTELSLAVDIMMARAKGIYILIIKVNKLFFFVALFSKRNKKTCSSCFYRVIETLVKVWENTIKLWKQSPVARVSTAAFVLPNVHSCLYSSLFNSGAPAARRAPKRSPMTIRTGSRACIEIETHATFFSW